MPSVDKELQDIALLHHVATAAANRGYRELAKAVEAQLAPLLEAKQRDMLDPKPKGARR